jgi:hypothetical protein
MMLDLSSGPKKTVFFSFLGGACVALATIADLIFGYPFAGYSGLDILFLLSAANVIYLAYDTWRDLVPRRRVSRKTIVVRRPADDNQGLEVAPSIGRARRGTADSRFATTETMLYKATPGDTTKPSRRNFAMSVPGSSRV